MAPRVVITPKSRSFASKLGRLKSITINGSKINIYKTSSKDIRLDIDLVNQPSITILDGNKMVEPSKIGIENVHLQDASGSYAYHIPEGILLHYNPKQLDKFISFDKWNNVSALDFAPSILKKFAVEIPSYMQKENIFIN